jgi:hypothetical protein
VGWLLLKNPNYCTFAITPITVVSIFLCCFFSPSILLTTTLALFRKVNGIIKVGEEGLDRINKSLTGVAEAGVLLGGFFRQL